MTVPTVYHITHHKAGSQWILGVLSDCASGRIVWPSWQAVRLTRDPIFQGMVYPTLYLSKHEFEQIVQPGPFRAFVVIRDLRDTLISYYSYLASPPPNGPFNASIERHALARMLGSMSVEDGLRWTMRSSLKPRAWIQASWVDGGFPIFRYEDLIRDDVNVFREILQYCEIDVSAPRLREIVSFNSFEKRSGRPLGVEDKNSHLRQGLPGNWRHYLNGDLLDEFKELYGDVLIKTGYENDRNWGRKKKFFLFGRDKKQAAPKTLSSTNGSKCWCGGDLRPYGDKHVDCAHCGSITHNSAFSKELIAPSSVPAQRFCQMVASRLRSETFIENEANWPTAMQARHELQGGYAAKRALRILRFKEPGDKVLDVGCGSGSIVALLKQAGLDAVGLDACSETVETARRALGVELVEGTFQNWQGERQSLDAISMFYTLQFMQQPLEALQKCSHLLKDDGLLVIEVVDFPENISFEDLGSKRPECLDLIKFELDLHFFNQRALKLLLEKTGFNVLETNEGIVCCSKTKLAAKSDFQIDTLLLKSPEQRFALALIDQHRTRQIEAQRDIALVVQMAQQLWSAQNAPNSKPAETGLVSSSLP